MRTWTRERKSELDARWSVRGTIKLVSYVACAVVSGYVWYGVIKGAQWLLRWLGVDL